ncbi:Na(+)/H(+) antiporter subunit B [Spirochaeta dissipatitropha]
MVEFLLLASIVLLALLALYTETLRIAVICFSVFSLITSFLYVFYQAPDVAIAEAVMGSGLITLLYLTALKRYRVYSVCYTNTDFPTVSDRDIIEGTRKGELVREIEDFCYARELAPQLVFTPQPVREILQSGRHDLIIHQSGDKITILGNSENFVIDELEVLLAFKYQDLKVLVERYGGSSEYGDNYLPEED